MDELYEMVLEDENGNQMTYIFVDTLRYKKKEYDLYKKKGTEEFEILEVGKETDEGVEYLDIDEELFSILMEKFKEEM